MLYIQLLVLIPAEYQMKILEERRYYLIDRDVEEKWCARLRLSPEP